MGKAKECADCMESARNAHAVGYEISLVEEMADLVAVPAEGSFLGKAFTRNGTKRSRRLSADGVEESSMPCAFGCPD